MCCPDQALFPTRPVLTRTPRRLPLTTFNFVTVNMVVIAFCSPSFTFVPQLFTSRKWGFTKFDRDEYEELRANYRLRNDGVNVQYLREHGPLKAWKKVRRALED